MTHKPWRYWESSFLYSAASPEKARRRADMLRIRHTPRFRLRGMRWTYWLTWIKAEVTGNRISLLPFSNDTHA